MRKHRYPEYIGDTFIPENAAANRRLDWEELLNMECADCGRKGCLSVDACKEWQATLQRVRENAVKIIGQ